MNKLKAIELLKKEDIKTIIRQIKEDKSKVVFWREGRDRKVYERDIDLWFIDDVQIYDYLQFYCDGVSLHWTKLIEDLITAIATNPSIKIYHE